MQVPPTGLPAGGLVSSTRPTLAAGGEQHGPDPLDTLVRLVREAPLQRRRLDATPPAPPIPGPLGPVLDRIAAAGYSFTLDGKQPVERQQLAAQLEQGPADEVLSRLGVSRTLPQPPGRLAGALDPFLVEKACVSNWAGLRLLDSLTGEPDDPRARDLLALEKAGCKLMVAGADYRAEDTPGDGLLHRKVLIIDTSIPFELNEPSRPTATGAFGVLQSPDKKLWIQPFGADRPMPLENLDHARFFLLGQSVPALEEDPLARQLRSLEQSGVQFGAPSRGNLNAFFTGPSFFGALGAYRHNGPVAVHLRGAELARVTRGQDGLLDLGSDLQDALAFPERDTCDPELLKILALPLGVSREERLALVERLAQGGIPLSCPSLNSWGWKPSDGEAFLTLKGLSRQNGHPPSVLVDQVLELTREESVGRSWAVDAAAHLIDHPEDRQPLLALAGLGGDFAGCLAAHQVLQSSGQPYSEGFQVLKGLVEARVREIVDPAVELLGIGVITGDSRQNSFESARKLLTGLMAERHQDLSLEADLALAGQLEQRFGLKEGFELRRKLAALPGAEADKVDRLLREHRLSGDPGQALLCLQPGGHPDLPEPLELREQVAALVQDPMGAMFSGRFRNFGRRGTGGTVMSTPHVGLDLNAYYNPTNSTMNFGAPAEPETTPYEFLLGLPERRLLEDAQLYTTIRPHLGEEVTRTAMTSFKSGQLGRLTAAEFQERLRVEAALRGPGPEVWKAVEGGQPDFAERQALVSRLEGRFQNLPETYQALQTPMPSETSLDDAIGGLARMHEALDPSGDDRATRQYFTDLVEAVREGPWQGQTLREGVDRFLQLFTLGGPEKALKALQSPPAEGGFVAGVRADRGGVTIGGVRLRTRS